MKYNVMSQLSLTAIMAEMFVIAMPVNASENNSKVEASSEKTYFCKTYLRNDAIKTKMKTVFSP